jgi:two-component system OmpR family sensor kinase
MKAFYQSIRWRMQAWHGLLLFAVLTAFGIIAYCLVRDNQLKSLDHELQRRLAVVVAGMMPPLPPMPFPPDLPLPPALRSASEGARLFPRFRLSAEELALFGENQSPQFYFVVWSPDGAIISSSSNAPPAVPMPIAKGQLREGVLRQRGDLRELAMVSPRIAFSGPFGVSSGSHSSRTVVGCSIATELSELNHLAWLLAGLGTGVLGVGLVVGWWLSARSVRPIADISAIARRIAIGNLSERIDLTDTESELGGLARVLNEMFDGLQAAFARQAQFTADASHELRTPLFVILSQAQSALKRERTSGEYREGFRVCERAAQQMRQLIEALLVLARQDSDNASLSRASCALDQIATETVDLLRPLAGERNVSLHLDASPAPLSGDAQQLRQVVTNLVSNAIEYNRPNGEVKVTVRCEGNTAVLIVGNDGPGIAAEDLPHIFERFYRADKSRSNSNDHTGLGLAICKAIVQAHRGCIEASSRINQGAVFTVRFPPRAHECGDGSAGL